MRGSYRIIIQNRRVHYDFVIKRNITVIKGNSGTGKTTLIDMLAEYESNGRSSGISVESKRKCMVISGSDWQSRIKNLHDTIIFIDEENGFVTSKEFARTIKETNNYYVIILREGIEALPYSVEEIYGIRTLGKYNSLVKTYNEFYRIYGDNLLGDDVALDTLYTEDSNSGWQFFNGVCKKNGIECISAEGKSNIVPEIFKLSADLKVLIVADGAAFGSQMEKVDKLLKQRPNTWLYLPESFEWMILKANIVEYPDLNKILEHPEEYIESAEFFSWERYFTDLLMKATQDTYLQYSKSKLNDVYLSDKLRNKILGGIIYEGLY